MSFVGAGQLQNKAWLIINFSHRVHQSLLSDLTNLTHPKSEDPGVRLGQALPGWHHLHKELWVHGEAGQGGQQPAVT